MSLEFEDEKKITVNDIFKSIGIVVAVVLIGYVGIQKFTSSSKPHIVTPKESADQAVVMDTDVKDAYEWVFTAPNESAKGDRNIRQDLRDNSDLMKYIDSDIGFEFQIPQFCTGCFVDQQTVEDIPEWPSDVYKPRVFLVKSGSVVLAQVVEISSDYVDLFSQYKYKLTTLLDITPLYSYYLVSGKDLPDQSFDQSNWPIADFGYADWGAIVQCIYSTFWIPDTVYENSSSDNVDSSGVDAGDTGDADDMGENSDDLSSSPNSLADSGIESENDSATDSTNNPADDFSSSSKSSNSNESDESLNFYVPGENSNPVNTME